MNIEISGAEHSIKANLILTAYCEGSVDHAIPHQAYIDSYIAVQAATRISGYSASHLRRLLRAGKLEGIRAGQAWLINPGSLAGYLYSAISANDMRHGPHKPWQPPF
jgi:hypothetical protein